MASSAPSSGRICPLARSLDRVVSCFTPRASELPRARMDQGCWGGVAVEWLAARVARLGGSGGAAVGARS
eukprot:scaffold2658_cov98-Isochrysis_galbana.AAC.4